MAYSVRVMEFASSLNRGIRDLASDINTVFSGGSVQLLDADFHRLQSPHGGDRIVVTILYAESTAGIEMRADLFITDSAATAQDKFNAYFSGNCFVPLKTLDVTNHELNRLNLDTLLVLSAKSDNADHLGLLGHDGSVFIAEPIANIAADTTGNCIIYDSNGRQLSSSFAVHNAASVQWDAGDRSYIFFDATSGLLISQAVCNGVPAALSPDPCPTPTPPASPCFTREVASVDPVI